MKSPVPDEALDDRLGYLTAERDELASRLELVEEQTEYCADLERALATLRAERDALAREVERLRWRCRADSRADPPIDCGFPFCGCDPDAERVIETLQACGWLDGDEAAALSKRATAAETEVARLKERVERMEQALRDAELALPVLATMLRAAKLVGADIAEDMLKGVRAALSTEEPI